MKRRILLTLLFMVLSAGLYSQIKIGDNPQNLDPSSVLELESSNRVFVITRISTAEMNAITPLPGAMVYNTDEQCLFYYEGTEWINLCDALRLTFTADPIVNDYSTIVITESADNVNFEVLEIRGQNIVDFTITSVDIQNNAITSSKLAPDSVGNEELQDNTITDDEMDYSQVTLIDFTNDAGYITSAAIVSADAGNSIIPGSDNGAFLDLTPVQTALNDLDVAVTTISLVDNGDGTYSFSDSMGNIQLITTNGLTITNTVAGNLIATVTLSDGSSTNINETITSLTDTGDGFITYTTEDGTQETVAKSDMADNGDGTYTFTNNDGTDVILNTNGLTITNTVPGNLIATLTLADGSSTSVNETITALTDNGDGLITFTKENGGQDTVAKSDITDNLDGTYTFTNNDGSDVILSTNGLTVTNTIAGNLIATLTLADGSSTNINETVTSIIDNSDGFVTFIKEDGTQDTVAKADITDNLDGTYTFTNNDGVDVTITTNGLVVTNTVAGNLIATLTQADGSNTDINETITALVDNGDGFVTFTKEDGTQDTVAKADITDNTDGTYTFTNNDGVDVILDFNAAALPFDNTILGNLTATDVQAAIDEVSTAVAGGSDDQNISGSVLIGTDLTIGIENGTNEIVDLSSLVDDADADPANEYNTALAMNAGALEITDIGATLSESLISTDANNDLLFGVDGRLYVNVDAAASGETNTTILDNGDGTFTYTNELGAAEIISKADLIDNADGTYTFTNNDGSDETIDTRAASNPYDNTITGLLIASDVQGALDELAAGSDSQDISTDNSPGNISIQNGSTLTLNVDDADSDPTNELQTLSQAGNNVTLSDGGGTISVADNDNDPTNENQTVSAGTA
ncbi:beta strand repeat-containing protein, partial [Muriicola sp. E247]|uniref:beta strand repeat-containing protein n=1 Tax=Muriicola sp. E247 TaxID=3242730 RepID=UPI0035264A50